MGAASGCQYSSAATAQERLCVKWKNLMKEVAGEWAFQRLKVKLYYAVV